MRGGTSKGPLFLASDLPQSPERRDQVLLSLMGWPDPRQIDGIGGGDSLTSQALIVGPSWRPGIDVEYLFAQVSVTQNSVDTTPACGNMLAAVAPFAIERGLMAASDPSTTVRIFNVNTAKIVEAVVRTPAGRVTYEGDVGIDGVPGTGAAIVLEFLAATGAKTGKMLPSGRPLDIIDGIPVSCVDVSTPMVLLEASSIGKTGYEANRELDADQALLARLERLRLQAARLMGMGDVSGQVLPKLALLAPPRHGGNITSRYFVPWNCHAAHSVTGGVCIAAACFIPGSIAASVVRPGLADEDWIAIEHPMGQLAIRVQLKSRTGDGLPDISKVSVIRTARPLFEGVVYLRSSVSLGRGA
jgi:4-oxalomesaconate tautomerase